MNVRAIRAAEDIGKTRNHPPVCREVGRTHAVVQVTGGRGGGGEYRRPKNQEIKTFRDRIIRGSRILMGLSLLPGPPPPNCQVLPVSQLGSENSCNGNPGRAESGEVSQELSGACRRQVVSEGSLLPKRRAGPAPSGAGGSAREGESKSARDRAGVGSGRLGWWGLRRG